MGSVSTPSSLEQAQLALPFSARKPALSQGLRPTNLTISEDPVSRRSGDTVVGTRAGQWLCQRGPAALLGFCSKALANQSPWAISLILRFQSLSVTKGPMASPEPSSVFRTT